MDWHAFISPAINTGLAALAGLVTYITFRVSTGKDMAAITVGLKDTNERLTKLGEGVSAQRTEITEFKEHVRSHYVETGDLNEVKHGFQNSMNDLRDDVREATGTMSDVRDVVQRMEVKLFPDKPSEIPPKRRRAPAKSGV